ncbi:MAG: CPBP family intramembrane metalloprotease [Spirochaetales bacterium]|nr:CPBP family intramembrane metalloprotease [Spirochaetales bacterium]
MLENNRSERILAPAILFCALFLPGYLYQSAETASVTLTDPSLLAQNLIFGIPQAALILYMILTRGHGTKEATGIVPISAKDILKVLAGTAGLFLIAVPAALAGGDRTGGLFTPVTAESVRPVVLMLFAPVSLVTGYREELFFRSYLLVELAPFGNAAAVAVGSLLFALGHVYQGIGAFVVTAFIGIFLSWLFLRTRNVHIVALSHGIYNYLVFVVGALL